MPKKQSFAVIGAGIIGAAVARELTRRFPDAAVTIFEKEASPAAHQTGHNSGVVHAGLYYEPAGLKARLCRRGVGLLRELCSERGLPYEACGKVLVALDAVEEGRLDAIFERAVANGVPGVRMLNPEELQEIEPNVVGRRALHSPETAIVDYTRITEALIDDIRQAGGTINFVTEVHKVSESGTAAQVATTYSQEMFDFVIVCAGLQSDRLAVRSGEGSDPSIVPFFGQYFVLEPAFRHVVKGLVYPVADPKYPFLGVHLTKRIDGETTIGPNAFLSLSREVYSGLGANLGDILSTMYFPGFWRFAGRNTATAAREIQTVVSKKRFIAEAQKYVPSIEGANVVRAPRGIRAQALSRDGGLVDDFIIQQRGRITHVRNAPSPGATSSMAIAEYIVDAAISQHSLTARPKARE
ncbi:L-2-hydroxyglutarate oxidase [Arthrobacter sp. MI7-26]|uniref:L-2-hydroxyglutarate oxidase n=1 Tax=Arthrobacter sp. MI7-26 TaxID=2993653 RepID=UPI00224881F8|nr:L-2-hydroxyglutarate oxidase [Arthrobacter sp. MI7-26]MCX2750048.1 L-2-hydroxyglutarate oxidase [Arthrobacter sp. MI7-26]